MILRVAGFLQLGTYMQISVGGKLYNWRKSERSEP